MPGSGIFWRGSLPAGALWSKDGATAHTQREPHVTESSDAPRQRLSIPPQVAGQAQALEVWFIAAESELRRKNWSAAFTTYPRLNLDDVPVPWAGPPADVRGARFCLVGSAGIYLPDQPRFEDGALRGDLSWRALPVDTDLTTTRIAHEHYGHDAAEADRNAVYPLGQLRALAAAGEIGGLTPTHFSFSGYIPNWVGVMEQLAPALADQVVAQRPDAALLVPV